MAVGVEACAEAGLPLAVGFGREVRCGALLLEKRAETVSVLGLVGEHDRVRAEMFE